jgi:hypothetical protein
LNLEEEPEYAEVFSQHFGVRPKEIDYQKFILDIRGFTTDKMYKTCQKLRKYNDIINELNYIGKKNNRT